MCNQTSYPRRRESGAALLVAMLLLAMMALIGFASMDTVMRDRQVAGNTGRHQSAVYAADAGISAALDVIHTEILPPAVQAGYCLANTVPNGTLPNNTSFGPDTTLAPNKICLLAAAEPCPGTPVGGPYVYTVWNVRAQGQAPGGSVSRVQATVNRCLAMKQGGYNN